VRINRVAALVQAVAVAVVLSAVVTATTWQGGSCNDTPDVDTNPSGRRVFKTFFERAVEVGVD
jgi:hypothetical protein